MRCRSSRSSRGRSRAGRLSRRCSSVPLSPATGSTACTIVRSVRSSQITTSRAASSRAVTRSERESPEPSTIRTPSSGTPASLRSRLVTAAPAAVAFVTRRPGADRLQHHLGREVVALVIHELKLVRERRRVDRCERHGALAGSTGARSSRNDPTGPEQGVEPGGCCERRVDHELPVAAGAVDDECEERRRFGAGERGQPARGDSLPVEVGRVTDDPAGHPTDPLALEDACETTQIGGRERRVAESPQHEPALPGASGSSSTPAPGSGSGRRAQARPVPRRSRRASRSMPARARDRRSGRRRLGRSEARPPSPLTPASDARCVQRAREPPLDASGACGRDRDRARAQEQGDCHCRAADHVKIVHDRSAGAHLGRPGSADRSTTQSDPLGLARPAMGRPALDGPMSILGYSEKVGLDGPPARRDRLAPGRRGGSRRSGSARANAHGRLRPCALSLEADRARVRRQVKHLASGVANQGAGTGEELSTLLQRLDAGAREVERLRSLLTSLRRRYSAALIR